ncbi:MAG: thiol-disulfide isomerase/thioredoxin [Verrucomicrobiales bacterium]|jgi:thiol-disulfide isomerase/thioredoxin
MKLILTSIIALGLSLPLALNAETAQEILTKHEQAKADALKAYLAANPEAPDAAEARGFLIASLTSLDDTAGLIPLFEERMAGFAGKPIGPADLDGYFGTMLPLFQFYTGSGEKDKAKALIRGAAENMGPLLQDPQMGPQIGQLFQQLEGQLAMPSIGDTLEIAFTSTTGAEVDLAKMKGKVVLVDFWATWCGPCIAEMPNVIAAYGKYKDKGFEVLGISLDQSQASLDEYVAENKMTWPQFFDGKGWETQMVTKLGITGIPATFLIGKDGKVAASNLRGAELEKKVAELLAAE